MPKIEWIKEPPYGDNPKEPGDPHTPDLTKCGWELKARPFSARVFHFGGMWLASVNNQVIRQGRNTQTFESAELAKHAVEIEVRDRAREIAEALKEVDVRSYDDGGSVEIDKTQEARQLYAEAAANNPDLLFYDWVLEYYNLESGIEGMLELDGRHKNGYVLCDPDGFVTKVAVRMASR